MLLDDTRGILDGCGIAYIVYTHPIIFLDLLYWLMECRVYSRFIFWSQSHVVTFKVSNALLSCDLKRNRFDIICCVKLPEGQETKTDGFLFRFFKKVYAPFILKEWVRPIIVSISVTLCQFFTSVSPHLTGTSAPLVL